MKRYPAIDVDQFSKEEFRQYVREACPWVSDELFEEFWQEMHQAEKRRKAAQ